MHSSSRPNGINVVCPSCHHTGSILSSQAQSSSQFTVIAVLSVPSSASRSLHSHRDSTAQQAEEERKWHWSQEQKGQFSEAFKVLQEEGLPAPQPKQVMKKMIETGMNMTGLTLRRIQSYHQKYTDRQKRSRQTT